MNRRSFVAAGTAALASTGIASAAEPKRRRVAVIGHTGRGNYGHGLDTVWLGIPETEVVGVADADEKGLATALKKLRVAAGFSDYRKMLSEVKPEFVTVAPRHADQHAAMALAAIEAGVKGIYVEKPFCRTPDEADQLVAACDKHVARIAVAHRNRYHPVLKVIDQFLADGKLGKLLEIRGRGKGDRRGGGEDLWVLGSHVMNLICYFGGTPVACSAVMLQDGRRVTRADVKDGAEGLGPLAGNEVRARYEMSKGGIATFDSLANDGTKGAGFGLQLIGSEGVIQIRCDCDPVAHLVPGNPFLPTNESRPWIPVTSAGVGAEEPQPELVKLVQNHVIPVRDLIAACDEKRDPLCSARDGALAVEMICGVFASHLEGSRAVRFSLEERGNALRKL